MLALLLLASPCLEATAIDQGQSAACSGVLITTAQAKKMVTCSIELKAWKDHPCPPCPPCAKQRPDNKTSWFLGGALVGTLASGVIAGLLALVF
jgi:hypothetical protein